MKLARPDVFHPRIVLAGCSRLVEGDGDDDGLVAALAAQGLTAHWRAWDDPETLQADLVILRATWDYTERLGEFLDWTRRVPHLLNAPSVVAWNSDKNYLHDLAVAGIPVCESDFFAPGELVHLPAGEVVVKPAVGAGSRGVQRFTDHTAARDHVATMQEAGVTVLVQPYDARIEDGEIALVFVAGEQSHAFLKAPMLPAPGRQPALDPSGIFAEESLHPADPDFELWDVGHAVLAAAADRLGVAPTEFLYARVDLIGRRDPTLLELELVEPSLGWRQLDAATRQRRQRGFALAVGSALDRLGLGPFAHRRP
ncbi:hypothetical protein [[Mycobacterium] wendilense]|uniref:ATP-grasp domain-containing protein n=1 Tax=[Mycobacterium] wendilense TaxID=3064284 RepID=A0ABN9NZ97_9MYCO|nr:hypothetical protein [Mycolicibacterium sp. MU0050]CAJ1583284.1 hypothetical protein MU0050_002531 [Mycolicibacterium sp. MU0050]